MIPPSSRRPAPTRRTFLRLAAVGLAGTVAAACTRGGTTTDPDGANPTTSDTGTGVPGTGATATASDTTTGGDTFAALTPADFEPLATCQLLPEKTAGPFPLDEQFVRRDVTEGYPGHPVRLGLRVVDADCVAVPGAAVEIWHCDATGDYSAFADGGGGKDEAGGTTFLRGTQVAGEDGIVEFHTIYPGWYAGRCVHIHLRVHVDDTVVLTTQLVFEDEYTAQVLTEAPYAEFGLPDTLVGQDMISRDAAGEGTYLAVTAGAPTAQGSGTLALINLGIDSGAAA